MPGRVMLVEDHQGTLAFLRTCMRYVEPAVEVVGEATDAEEAITLALQEQPDIILMDFILDPNTTAPAATRLRVTGLEASRQILSVLPNTRVILITGWGDSWLPDKARELGIFGFWNKGTSLQALLDLITRALQAPTSRAGAPWDPIAPPHELQGPSLAEVSQPPSPMDKRSVEAVLTSRELEVLLLVGKGKANKEIAHMLQLTVRAVESHVTRLLEKLRVSSRVEAALWAKDHPLPNRTAENVQPQDFLLHPRWLHAESTPPHDPSPQLPLG